MAFDLNSSYFPALGDGGQSIIPGTSGPPSTFEALVSLIAPYLQSMQGQRSAGMDALVRGLQTLRGGGIRDSLTGAIRNPNPLTAQAEHDAYWNGMFTSPAAAIAKERARFDPQGLRPGQKTFTEQAIERMNQSPQSRVNAAMGPGWEGMNPAQRRVVLQQAHGQVPDFQDPLTGQVQAPQVARRTPLTPADQVLAATLAGTPNPTPMNAAPSAMPVESMGSPSPTPINVSRGGPTVPWGPIVNLPSNPLYGVGTLRTPPNMTPNPNAPILPNFRYAVGDQVAPQPWQYGVGTLVQ
jgi:hypothetical protein